jgi:hypothetical protein
MRDKDGKKEGNKPHITNKQNKKDPLGNNARTETETTRNQFC